MSEMWYIIASIPVVLITSIFLGYEAPFYYGISLIGFAFWRFGNDEKVKKIGTIICLVGTLLFFITFVYYLISGIIFPDKPFEFKTLSFIYGSIKNV